MFVENLVKRIGFLLSYFMLVFLELDIVNCAGRKLSNTRLNGWMPYQYSQHEQIVRPFPKFITAAAPVTSSFDLHFGASSTESSNQQQNHDQYGQNSYNNFNSNYHSDGSGHQLNPYKMNGQSRLRKQGGDAGDDDGGHANDVVAESISITTARPGPGHVSPASEGGHGHNSHPPGEGHGHNSHRPEGGHESHVSGKPDSTKEGEEGHKEKPEPAEKPEAVEDEDSLLAPIFEYDGSLDEIKRLFRLPKKELAKVLLIMAPFFWTIIFPPLICVTLAILMLPFPQITPNLSE